MLSGALSGSPVQAGPDFDQYVASLKEQALAAGVDFMVIGRPVTQSANPAETLKAINASLKKGA